MNRRTFLMWATGVSALGLTGCNAPAAAAPPVAQLAARAEDAPPLPGRRPAEGIPAASIAEAPVAAPTRGLPDRLEIPSINLDIPVVELGWSVAGNRDGQIFSEWDVAEYAAGWHKNSALPGDGGNVVMSGHNNILGAVFRELDRLRKDDAITVWVGEKQYAYRVQQVVVMPETKATHEQRVANARWIAPFDDERLTLVSCWPRNNNTHRIVVVARPLSQP
jgi:sortase A